MTSKANRTTGTAQGSDAFRIGPRVIAGFVLGLFLIGGVGGWAATAKLSGAVISPGVVIVDQNLKQVQHRDGGIVSEIAVKEGDVVAAGQVLVRLEDTQTRAELSIVRGFAIQDRLSCPIWQNPCWINSTAPSAKDEETDKNYESLTRKWSGCG